MLAQYRELRRNLLAGIEAFKNIAMEKEKDKLAESLTEVSRKIEENRFYLVVLGEFKRGKTTFMNALWGQPLLPTAVVPLTSIVTMVKYGPKGRVEVMFDDCRVEEIPLEYVHLFVTEKGNPGNEKGVRKVEVSYPSPFLQDGVYLVDTPGVGSVFSNNTEVTYRSMPKADAAILLLSSDPPKASRSSLSLGDLRQPIRKVFFV